MPEHCSQTLLQRALECGAFDADTEAWMLGSLRRWLAAGGQLSLTACLGIPARPGLVKIAMRDQWLREGAAELPGGPWDQAAALRAAANRFESGKWRFWKHSPLPPPDATRLEKALHLALRSGAKLPRSIQQYRNILATQTEVEGNLGEIAGS